MKLFCLLCSLTLLGGVAFAQKDSTAIATLYRSAEKMFEKRDAEGLYAATTPDFTETFMGQTRNRSESVQGLKQFLAMYRTLHARFKVGAIKVVGDTATSEDVSHIWGTTSIDPKTKKPHKVDASRKETMTWAKVHGKWLIKKIVATDGKMMMDGKPMPIAKRA